MQTNWNELIAQTTSITITPSMLKTLSEHQRKHDYVTKQWYLQYKNFHRNTRLQHKFSN